jgi:hypothetical protein
MKLQHRFSFVRTKSRLKGPRSRFRYNEDTWGGYPILLPQRWVTRCLVSAHAVPRPNLAGS